MATITLEPNGLKRTDWSAYFQQLDAPVRHDKKYMVTKWVENVPLSKLVGALDNQGNDVVVGMTDGIQAIYLEVNNGAIPYVKTWTNARASCGSGVPCFDDPIEVLAQSIYNGNRERSIVFSQMMEDSSIHGSSNPDLHSRFSKVEQVFKRVAELMLQLDGITVDLNELICDYFAGIFGWDTNSSLKNIGEALAIQGLSSENEARKTNYIGEGGPFLSNYFSQQAYNYRHRIAPGYVEGLGSQYNGMGVYNQAYNLERQYVQHPTRKVCTYATGTFEGINFQIDRRGVWQSFPVASPAGDLIRLSSIESPYDMNRTQTLIGLLIGDRYVIWDDNSRVGLDDKCFNLAYFGGEAPWKNRWRAQGSSNVVQYNAGASGQPVSVCVPGTNGFPTNPGVSNNGSWAGNYLYGKVYDRCNGSLRWPTFNYVEDGVAKTGYYNGNDPIMGSLGSEVSRWGKANYGQHNIVKQFYNGKKPIVWAGTGINTSKKVWFVLNLNAGFMGTTTYNIEGTTITHVGDSMGVYIN